MIDAELAVGQLRGQLARAGRRFNVRGQDRLGLRQHEWRVDRVPSRLALEDGDDLLGHLPCHLGLRLLRGRPQVRRNDYLAALQEGIVAGGRLLGEHVDGRARYAPLVDGPEQGGLIDELAPGRVQDAGRGFHQRDPLVVHQAACCLGERRVEADEVGVLEYLVQLHKLDAQEPSLLVGHKWVVAVDLHLEAAGPPSDLGAHLAQADDAKHLVANLNAHERAPPPLAAAKGLVGLGYVPGQGHHQGDGVLGGGNGVACRGVHHRYALSGGGFQVDVVDAHTGAANHLELLSGVYHLGRGLGLAADHQRLILPDYGEKLAGVHAQLYVHVAHGLEHLNSEGVYGVGHEYPGHQEPRAATPVGWNPTLGSTSSSAFRTWSMSPSLT